MLNFPTTTVCNNPNTASSSAEDSDVHHSYFAKYKILDHLENAVIALSGVLPSDPMVFLSKFFLKLSASCSNCGCQTDFELPKSPCSIVSTVHFSFDGLKLEPMSVILLNRVPIAEVDQDFAPYLTHLASNVRKGTS